MDADRKTAEPSPARVKWRLVRSGHARARRPLARAPTVRQPFKLATLEDLLHIAWNYTGDGSDSTFDWFRLWKLIPVLEELAALVGMAGLKQTVVDFVVCQLQGMDRTEMLHTVLYGPPGVGKTTVAVILARLYYLLGFVETPTVVSVKRTDLIGKYLGHTEDATKKALESALGGVLFIDEAYSLGNASSDIYSKAVIDILTAYLSTHKGDFVCIIAGYKDDIDKFFFSVNKGLERRFPWRHTLGAYSAAELHDMFVGKVAREGWRCDPAAISAQFFSSNKSLFRFFGGDVENFFLKCKIAHLRRVFGAPRAEAKRLRRADVDAALKSHKNSRGGDDRCGAPPSMFM